MTPICAVLKVFGIYEDEPVSGSFWSSVGRELGKKGEEYKYRYVHNFMIQIAFLYQV
jgi:hypothetical protein